MKLKSFLLLPVAALALIAASCDDRLAAQTCNSLAEIYLHYDNVKASGVIPVKYTRPVDTGRVYVDQACANPEDLSTAQLAGIAARAYVALRAALEYGQGQGDADYEASVALDKLEILRAKLQKVRN